MTKPHKHAALIIAWANGAVVECRYPGDANGWEPTSEPGSSVDTTPGWFDDYEYRVKPAPQLSDEAVKVISEVISAAREVESTGHEDDWKAFASAKTELCELSAASSRKFLPKSRTSN